MGDTARFFLAGFGFNFIRHDDTDGVPDYATHLHGTLRWFQNFLADPTVIDPVAFENRLENAYPNPFNPTTTIRYSIAEPGHVSLKIYNAAGAPVASGVCFYRLEAKGFSQTKKLVCLK